MPALSGDPARGRDGVDGRQLMARGPGVGAAEAAPGPDTVAP